jgi:hypothetical protein
MARTARIEVGALNIVASPHPPGVYRTILKAVADKEVHLWGSDMAKITEFREFDDDPDRLQGRILVWAEIDIDGKWLNKKKNVEATPDEKQVIAKAIPSDFEPNFRSFNYVFVESKHRMVVEFRNELGQQLGPSRAEKLFERLFEHYLPKGSPNVEVTVIPKDDSLDNIYKIPGLRWLEIVVKRPNADDVESDAARVLGKLEGQGARSQKLELTKAAGVKQLKPDEDTKALAAVAAENGYVAGEGKDADGKPIFESTKKHPKVYVFDVEGQTSFGTFLTGLRFFS